MKSEKIVSNLSVDCVIIGFQEAKLKVLLIKRTNRFMKSQWALPGHNIYESESAEQAASRILFDMSGVKNIYLDQIAAFSEIKRVEKRRIVTIGFIALINIEKHRIKPFIKEAEDVHWFDIKKIPKLALDHEKILEVGIFKLKRRFRFEPLGFVLLPEKFSLRDLQNLYESLFEIEMDNRNFRKKILKFGHLQPLDEKEKNVSHRSAQLYKFDEVTYNKLRLDGINIDVFPASYFH